jgi:transposase-like protein
MAAKRKSYDTGRKTGFLLRLGNRKEIAKVVRVMKKHDFRIAASAAALEVSQNTLSRWLDEIPELRTAKERTRGKHGERKLTHRGVTLTVSEWCERLDISRSALYAREANGLEGDALFAPNKRPELAGDK